MTDGQIPRKVLDDLYDSLHLPVQRGRYAEAGYNDHFNDGLAALYDALSDGGWVQDDD